MSLADLRMPSIAARPHGMCVATPGGASSVGDGEPAIATFPYSRLPDYTAGQVAAFPGLVGASSGARGGSTTELKLPPDFQQYESKNKRFQLRSWAWRLAVEVQPLCDVRMVYISGTKNTIINTWVFPYSPHSQPVFAAELIALGDQPKLTFMDIQGPGLAAEGQAVASCAGAEVATYFGDLRIAELPPAWAIDESLGQYMFTRDLPSEMASRVAQAYELLLKNYLELVASLAVGGFAIPVLTGEQMHAGLDELHRYQLHHLESSPGKVFLSKLFGDQWTESFLNDFLFCRPGELA